MDLRTLSTSGLLFALAAFGYHLAEPRLTEYDVRARVERLRAGEHIETPTTDREPPPVDALVLFRRLEGVGVWLERRAPWREGLGAPWRWEPSEAERLEEELRPLGTFFHEIKRILDEDACRRALADGRRLARPAPLFGSSPEELLVDTPNMSAIRNWSNLLCARAIVASRRPETREEAARRLGQALDLAQLVDDGSSLGMFMRGMGTSIVMLAVRSLLDEGMDAGLLRRALDDRLARAVRPEDCEGAFASDVSRAVRVWEAVHRDGVEGIAGRFPVSSTADLRTWLEDYEAHLAGARPLCAESELIGRSSAVRVWKLMEMDTVSMRLTLAAAQYRAEQGRPPASLEQLAELFEDGIPSLTCGHARIELDAEAEDLHLVVRAAAEGSKACVPPRQLVP